MPLAGSYEVYNRALDTTYAALDQEREEFRKQLAEELASDVQKLRDAGYTVRCQVEYGEPAQCIVDYVVDTHVDMVAMATHGRGGLGRLVMGSVAERVLRSVSVPVLLMRPEVQTSPADKPSAGASLARSLGRGGNIRIAAATDGSPSAQHAMVMAASLTCRLGTQLTAYVVASDRQTSAQAQKIMRDANAIMQQCTPRPNFVPLVGYTDDVLLQQLEKQPQDLLVIGPFHDRGAGSQSAIGPAAQRLVQQTQTSVLVVKGHRSTFKRVLVCADVDDAAAITVGAQFAALLKAQLYVAHIIAPSAAGYLSAGRGQDLSLDQALAQGTRLSTVLGEWLQRLAAEGFDRSVLHLHRGTMPEGALELSHSGHHDLIVVGSRSTPGHFVGSAANSLVRYAESSVLLVRSRDA
jgi:nucleotide-binding universal stress UspA family protein